MRFSLQDWLRNSILGRFYNSYAPRGSLTNAAVTLGGATALSQIIGVLLSPVYSRLYTPADFGIFGVYNSIVAAALTVGSLSYERAIPICKSDGEGVKMTLLAIVIIFSVGLGMILLIGLGAFSKIGDTGKELGQYLWFVPIGVVVGGVFMSVSNWAVRRREIVAIAKTSVVQLASSNALNLGFGFLHPNPLGLIIASMAGPTAGVWSLSRRTGLVSSLAVETKRRKAIGEMWSLAKRFKEMAFIQTPSTLFNSLGIFLPGMLAAPFFGADFAGQLFMALKVIALPGTLIGGALRQVFFSGAAEVARERPQDLESFFDRAFSRAFLCSLSIPLFGLVAPWVIPFALGHRWREAGAIAFWLSLSSGVALSVSVVSSITNVVGHLKGQFVINVVRAVAVFLLFYLSARFGITGMLMVKGFVAVMIVNYIACYMLYKSHVRSVAATGFTNWTNKR